MYYCKKCGAALTPEKRFCSQCGTPVEEIASTAQPTTPQAETPAAATTAQPTAPQAEASAAAPTTQPTAPQVETPAAATTAQPTAPQVETPAAAPTTQPTTPQAETPAAATTAQPTTPQAETPAAAPTTQPTAPQVETPAAATAQPTAPQVKTPAAATAQPTAPQVETPAAATTAQPTAPQAEASAAAPTTQPTAPQQAAAPQNGTPVSPQPAATVPPQTAWQNPQQQAQPTQNAGQPTGQQPQMSWQDWQNFQNWQNAQQQGQKAANNINLSNGVQKLEESDSFMFRSLGLTLKTLMKKPVQLWGLSLLGVILQSLSNVLCAVPPILGMGVSSTLSAGMENVFLDAYHQKEINSKQIFSGFSSGKSFLRIAGGMLWRTLWLFLWALFALIPIVGWVIAPIMLVIKGISYSFTPYLLLRKKDISPLDALKRSMEMAKGYRAKIFLTYLICYAALLVIGLLLFLIAKIPVIGFIIVGIVCVVISVLCPLFFGVLRAAMFTEVVRLEKVTDIEL
ncbi:MAG: zinc-ribbon domain-containing protein [Ruminococcus sp.]|nr:zinc-ribbon domain-containing protein [Ruminococcus sp.]